MGRTADILALAAGTRGFLPEAEGAALYQSAHDLGAARPGGAWLELGSWCGRSTLYLGAAAEECGAVLFSLDHHHGSEENQAGWEHFDPDLVDPADGRLNTLPSWQRSVAAAALERTVVGLVGHSSVVAAHWRTPLDVLFIDGGHGRAVAWADFVGWAPHVSAGGVLLIHDVFPDPRDGGRPPFEIYEAALSGGRFSALAATGSLRALAAR